MDPQKPKDAADKGQEKNDRKEEGPNGAGVVPEINIEAAGDENETSKEWTSPQSQWPVAEFDKNRRSLPTSIYKGSESGAEGTDNPNLLKGNVHPPKARSLSPVRKPSNEETDDDDDDQYTRKEI